MLTDHVYFKCLGRQTDNLKTKVARLPDFMFDSSLIFRDFKLVAEQSIYGGCTIHPFEGRLDLNMLRLPDNAVVLRRDRPFEDKYPQAREAESLEFSIGEDNYTIQNFSDQLGIFKGRSPFN